MLRIVATLSVLPLIASGCGASQQPSSHAPPPHALGPPRVLVAVPGLQAFAQDGGQVAWSTGGRCPALHVRTIATGAETRIPRGRKCALTEWDVGHPAIGAFAFAGGRALWSVHTYGNFDYQQPQTASVSDPEIRSLGEEIANDGDLDFNGEFLGDLAGDGETLVYTTYRVSHEGSTFSVGGGSTIRVAGGKTVGVPGASGAIGVAVSGRRVALLRPAALENDRQPFSDDSTPVEIRDVQTGEVLGSFEHGGRAYGPIALAPGLAAVLVREDSSTRIETYSVDDGRRLAETEVPADTYGLSLAGETVVFGSGRTIHALNARSGLESVVAVAKGLPSGLSIEGRRIAWAEEGRILVLYLSPG